MCSSEIGDEVRRSETRSGKDDMLSPQQVEELICLSATMDRESITHRLLSFNGQFPVDFTRNFLADQPLDRLRHIFVALCLQNRHLPDFQVGLA
jgi:hypothetical protein